MKLYLEPRPDGAGPGPEPGPIVAADDPADVLAVAPGGNPLDASWTLDEGLRRGRVLLWSGSLGEGLFAAHPHTWMPPGRAALDRLCGDLLPRFESAGGTLCFRPHCRHVLSDVPSCLLFLRDHDSAALELAFAPAGLLEPPMLPTVEDHLERIFAGLGPHGRLCILHDVVAAEGGAGCRPVPLGHGRLPRDAVLALLAAHVPEGTPLVIMDDDLQQQRAWLGLPAEEQSAG